MNEKNLSLFKKIARMNQSSLKESIEKLMEKYYPKNHSRFLTKYFSFYEGNIPILLVAHLDTVFPKTPEEIFYDKEAHIMWSPQGLGADDRAGVFSILQILARGYKPHILFTTDEEVGGIGAKMLVHHFPDCPFNIKYIIELDRQGDLDCVFYNCANEDFQKYIESFNFITDWGTFTDISIICPLWRIAGVNLSVGYKNEHSMIETLNTNSLWQTINKVCKMLDDVEKSPHFKYIEDFDEDFYFSKNYSFADKKVHCFNCGKIFPESDTIPILSKTEAKYYCIDCAVEKLNWCKNCGRTYEIKDLNNELCPYCSAFKKISYKGDKKWQKEQPPKLMQ